MKTRALLTFVGGRDTQKGRVFVLRAFEPARRQVAEELYARLCAAYADDPQTELLFGLYPSADAFFRAEPTWSAQFPQCGDRTFGGRLGKGV